VSLADRLRGWLGRDEEPDEQTPAAEPAADAGEEDEEDDPSVYPLW
jgi:hypothetical protein